MTSWYRNCVQEIKDSIYYKLGFFLEIYHGECTYDGWYFFNLLVFLSFLHIWETESLYWFCCARRRLYRFDA